MNGSRGESMRPGTSDDVDVYHDVQRRRCELQSFEERATIGHGTEVAHA
jgi:hypothetical protein